MSVTTRRRRKGATQNERAALAAQRWAEYCERNKVALYGYGVPDRTQRYWVLRNPRGRQIALALAPRESLLDWTREGIPPGWSIREVSGMQYDWSRICGIPLVQGDDPRSIDEIR